jgi:hypothetical protein
VPVNSDSTLGRDRGKHYQALHLSDPQGHDQLFGADGALIGDPVSPPDGLIPVLGMFPSGEPIQRLF